MGVSIKERITGWVSEGVPCEHKDQEGTRNCKEPAGGGVIYDLGFDEDCVLGCKGHLSGIREEVGDKAVEVFVPSTASKSELSLN